jgi:hypothetical protein
MPVLILQTALLVSLQVRNYFFLVKIGVIPIQGGSMNNNMTHAIFLSLLGAVFSLSGCGAGLETGGNDPAPAVADSGMYRDVMAYCRIAEPVGIDATRDGWTTYLLSSDQYWTVTTGMVSAAGSSSQWETPLTLYVPLNNGAGAYGEPAWSMGVRMPTVLGKQSVACVRQASHTFTPPQLNIPGVPNPPPVFQTVWDSYSDRAIPVSTLPGRAVYGFEFVSNFAPLSGEVFFRTGKASVDAPSALSVCYLAPKSVQWSCAQPGVADAGKDWQLSVRTPKQGVYVLVAPWQGQG